MRQLNHLHPYKVKNLWLKNVMKINRLPSVEHANFYIFEQLFNRHPGLNDCNNLCCVGAVIDIGIPKVDQYTYMFRNYTQ